MSEQLHASAVVPRMDSGIHSIGSCVVSTALLGVLWTGDKSFARGNCIQFIVFNKMNTIQSILPSVGAQERCMLT